MTTTQTHQDANRATIHRWYNEMWGKGDSSRIRDCIAPTYLRHDVTGANNVVTTDTYTTMVDATMANHTIRDLTHFCVVEGDFIGTLGRFLFGESTQWDWVQLFRTENARLAETWLTGMGGTVPEALPRPDMAWTDRTVPDPALLPTTNEKAVVQAWYERLAAGADATACLAPTIRVHDIVDADAELTPEALQERWRTLMQHDRATQLELFLIQEGDIVFATGRWRLGDDKREWNWVQAFRLQDGKIVQTWITSIGGTDSSLHHSLMLWDETVLPSGATRLGADVEGNPPG